MPDLPTYDADQLALLYVQQYLHEAGYAGALRELEKSARLLFDDEKVPQASQLMQLVWKHIEDSVADVHDDGSDLVTEEEQLLHSGNNDFPVEVSNPVERLHTSNIISVRWSADGSLLFTGSGDGTVRCVGLDSTLRWTAKVGAGAILSLAVHQQQPGLSWVACGSMDGSVSVLCMETGRTVAACKPHTKYVIRVLWAGDLAVRVFAASHDQSVSLLELDPGRGALEVIKKVHFPAAVQDIALLPGSHQQQQQQQQVVVGLRGTNYLRLLDSVTLEELGVVNLNQRGDDHVSFFARHLTVSPDGRYLLVCTDAPRMIMLRIGSWQQTRNFYGLPMQQFHQPVAAWHKDGAYIFAAADAGQVYVFHVGSAKAVAVVKPHPGSNVRDLAYSAATNQLATCSFDRTVKVMCKS